MRDKMMLYGVTLAKRYTKRQKAYFLEEIMGTCSACGFTPSLQSRKSWTGDINNVIAGDLEKAKLLIAAAYDTPAGAFLPGYKYFPFHTDKNVKEERKNIAVQAVVTALPTIGAACLLRQYFQTDLLIFLFLAILFALVAVWIIRVKKNPVNFNRNSASLAVMAKVAEELKGRDDIAFVFLDQSVTSFEGLKLFGEKIAGQSKRILLLDCIACGDTIVAAHGEDALETAKRLVTAAQKQGLMIKEKQYRREKIEGNVLSFIPEAVYMASGSIENGEFVVKNTRSKKDVRVDMERLEKIKEVITELQQEEME